MSTVLEVLELGREPFAETYDRMLRHAEAVRKRQLDGKILLVEHDPIYTAGRATPETEIGADTIRIERGGKLTYHGPGQLVVYPVMRLPRRDVRAWLRSLEAFGVAVCRDFDLPAEPSLDGTGVFVAGSKVMSIGVAIRHWVNLHGISINVDMDLSPFQRIRPCGLDPSVMTDLCRASGRAISLAEVTAAARRHVSILSTEPADRAKRDEVHNP